MLEQEARKQIETSDDFRQLAGDGFYSVLGECVDTGNSCFSFMVYVLPQGISLQEATVEDKSDSVLWDINEYASGIRMQ